MREACRTTRRHWPGRGSVCPATPFIAAQLLAAYRLLRPQPVPLALLTPGVHALCARSGSPSHAGALGLARTVRIEAAGARLSCLDVVAEPCASGALAAARLVVGPSALEDAETEAAFAGGGWRVGSCGAGPTGSDESLFDEGWPCFQTEKSRICI